MFPQSLDSNLLPLSSRCQRFSRWATMIPPLMSLLLRRLELALVLAVYVLSTSVLYAWLVRGRRKAAASPATSDQEEPLFYSLLWFLNIVLVIVELAVLLQMDLFLNSEEGEEDEEEEEERGWRRKGGVLLISGELVSDCVYVSRYWSLTFRQSTCPNCRSGGWLYIHDQMFHMFDQ